MKKIINMRQIFDTYDFIYYAICDEITRTRGMIDLDSTEGGQKIVGKSINNLFNLLKLRIILIYKKRFID